MNNNIAAAEILESAAFVIGTGHHCKNTTAINQDGESVSPNNFYAVAWCALGALKEALTAFSKGAIVYNDAKYALEWIIGSSVLNWNDAPERTAAEVEAAMLQAAANLRGEA